MKRILSAMLCLILLVSLSAFASAETPENVIEVSTVTELLDAIAPGASIRLAPGSYNLTEARGYGGKNCSDYYTWESLGDGVQYGLVIDDVEDLRISGAGAEIVTDPRWATVLTFRHCDGLTLTGLSLGHTEAAEACEGGVLALKNCDDVTLQSCDLYGCGTTGIRAEGCYRLSVDSCAIHHCSSSALEFSGGRYLMVRGCEVYECGTASYGNSAWTLLYFYDARDLSLTDCSFRDNYADSFITGSFLSDTPCFTSVSLTDNHFDGIFGFDGKLELDGLVMTGNVINRWSSDWAEPEVRIDGETVTETWINEHLGSQFSAAGIGTVEAEPAEIVTDGAKTVHVSTADEFLAAIASDTVIVIDAEEIDLTTASSYGSSAADFWTPEAESFGDANVLWQEVYDGYALWIGNVSNFHIQGGRLVTQPRYAGVLNFAFCSDFSLADTTLGHTVGSECGGGVLVLYGCGNAIVDSCELYGCGIYGVQTAYCSDLHLQNTYIHDCSYGAAEFYASSDVTCLNMAVINCPSPAVSLEGCDGFVWENVLMDPDCSFDPAFG